MADITYLKGDATEPIGDGEKYILHIVNNIGLWGKGFVLALSEKWKEPEEIFYESHKLHTELGAVSFVPVTEDITVVNMYAQSGVRSYLNPIPIHYGYLDMCLRKVAEQIGDKDITVHMPKIGCGLAGGDWNIVKNYIYANLCKNNIPVFVYELEKSS